MSIVIESANKIQVAGILVLPGMAMLVMAVDAVREAMAPGSGQKVTGYRIKDALFLSTAIISQAPNEPTETMVHLRPVRRASEKEVTWSQVEMLHRLDTGSVRDNVREQLGREEVER
jgi:hypothetical protein